MAAKAPKIKPGGRDASTARKVEAQRVLRVHAEGSGLDFTVAPNNLPSRVRRELRDQIGKSVRDFLGQEGSIDIDSIVVLWWASRRVADERVSFVMVEAEWDAHYGDLTYDDIATEFVDVAAAVDPSTDVDADPEA